MIISPIHPPIPSNLALLPSCVLYLRPYGDPNGGTTFKDWSPLHNSLTKVRSPANSTTYKKFPSGSMYFAANSGNYLTAAYSSYFNLGGTGNPFAISYWFNPTSTQGTYSSQFQLNSTGSQPQIGISCGSKQGGLQVGYGLSNGSTTYNTYTTTITTGTWYHIAVIRVGSYLYCYVNGTLGRTITLSQNPYSRSGTSYLFTGGSAYTNSQNAYYDEFAIWNGTYGSIPTISQLYPQTRRLIG